MEITFGVFGLLIFFFIKTYHPPFEQVNCIYTPIKRDLADTHLEGPAIPSQNKDPFPSKLDSHICEVFNASQVGVNCQSKGVGTGGVRGVVRNHPFYF